MACKEQKLEHKDKAIIEEIKAVLEGGSDIWTSK